MCLLCADGIRAASAGDSTVESEPLQDGEHNAAVEEEDSSAEWEALRRSAVEAACRASRHAPVCVPADAPSIPAAVQRVTGTEFLAADDGDAADDEDADTAGTAGAAGAAAAGAASSGAADGGRVAASPGAHAWRGLAAAVAYHPRRAAPDASQIASGGDRDAPCCSVLLSVVGRALVVRQFCPARVGALVEVAGGGGVRQGAVQVLPDSTPRWVGVQLKRRHGVLHCGSLTEGV